MNTSTSGFLIDGCQQVFLENLLCILLIGSTQRDDLTPFSDIDIVVVIETMDVSQVAQLRTVIRSSARLIDCSILCWDELPKNPNNFCLGSHGCYQLELVLKQAKCVWGQNVLLTLARPTESGIRASIIRKVVEYTWWVRRMFVESNRERTLEMNYKLNSRLIKMIRDIMYLQGVKDSVTAPTKKITSKFLEEYVEVLTKVERQVIHDLSRVECININTANMSEEYFLVRYSIANKIHKWVLEMN